MLNQIKNKLKHYFFRLNNGYIRDHRTEGAAKPAVEAVPGNWPFHVFLALLVLVTTTLAGTVFPLFPFVIPKQFTLELLLHDGLPYSLSVMAILLSHEFGHYFAAKRFGVPATLPYFIPVPFGFGTMGAVIKTKGKIPSRKALMYIGAMGPVAGFLVSIPVFFYGMWVARVEYTSEVPLVLFGDPLIVKLATYMKFGSLSQGYYLTFNPYLAASWVGFLVTGLNLMPIGQLDGGHIMHALAGKKQRIFGWCMVLSLAVLSQYFTGWIIWIVLILTFFMVAHPPVYPGERLERRDVLIGVFCIIIFIFTFVPVPAITAGQ